ncbi:type II secretion system F family protein [Erythrobacter sp. HKB08]|uniref:type II secretion system F family protein n=1 Tax=Erythrobacter sp. HKB08 TaxID=2502843 RepID=UPI001008B734|nr:type II secretion system F family protein [Erythrobacter sp. HKB08]
MLSETAIRLMVLIAIFASIFAVSQLFLNFAWSRTVHTHAVNKRLRMIKQGSSREEVMAALRKNAPREYDNLPPFISRMIQSMQRNVMAANLPFTGVQALLAMIGGFAVVTVIMLILIVTSGFTLGAGVVVMALAIAGCATILLPVLIFNAIAQKRRKRIEEQFPVSLDVFVRALRAGHPVASAIDLLTREMEDPIGSEYGLVADEVSYGADLTDALAGMAERWDLEDIRMFVVSLSVQSETGGNLAEILENLTDVIRARASLYMKVRALSSEGRMTGWMLTILPVLAFVGLFSGNPGFYLDVAGDPMFIFGFAILITLYIMGFLMIRKLIDIKV